MKCPFCGRLNTRVVDSRPGKIDLEVRRRRECQSCLQRFTTYERVEEVPALIVKKDGRREVYDREKIVRGIRKACEKRAVSMDCMDEMVDRIEQELREISDREISSRVVGEKIIQALRQVDLVAYVRFASVYREFQDARDFIEEVRDLMPPDKKEGTETPDEGS